VLLLEVVDIENFEAERTSDRSVGARARLVLGQCAWMENRATTKTTSDQTRSLLKTTKKNATVATSRKAVHA
jgi:hypothetical protein